MEMEVKKKGLLERFLRGVEVLGNKIPNPMLPFISLCIIVVLASAICSFFNVSAVNPVTGETVEVVNLLTKDGFIRMLTNFVTNFTGTSAMGLTLTCMLGVGVAEASGLFQVALRGLAKAKGADLKIIIVFITVCVLADCAGGAGFVVLPPLGAMLWSAMGRNPFAGMFAAYASVTGAFASNILITSMDVINMVTGEKSTVQLSLAHDGEFGFTMTLTAPVGTQNKGLWANLYHYDTTRKQMLFETAAQVDSSGNVALKFTHASEYAIVLDESSHELPFTDTAKGAWYQGAVEYVYRNSIMTGTSATSFEPNAPLSRAMVAQILYNLEGQPTVEGESTFADASGHWAVNAIAWAQQTGVVNGYEDNTFRPNRAASREELAQMLYNYAKVKGYDLTASGDLTAFPDGSKVSSWAEAAMAWANGNELINGHDDGTLQPGGDSTRAQAASILMSFDLNLAN
mgnify:CR=1 FL=1